MDLRVTLGNARKRRVNGLRIYHQQMAPNVAPSSERLASIARFERVYSRRPIGLDMSVADESRPSENQDLISSAIAAGSYLELSN